MGLTDPILAGQAGGPKAIQCALILEDNPVGEDSRLEWQSFPLDGVDEGYSCQPYHELGGERMPQPAFLAYRGGNWDQFQLVLQFHAGLDTPSAFSLPSSFSANAVNVTDIDRLLLEMERKVRWCQALTFPLERSAGPEITRIVGNAFGRLTTGSERDTATQTFAKLKRADPPVVLVQFGTWYTIRGLPLRVGVRWLPPWHPVTARPYGAEVTIAIQPLKADYPTWQVIRNQGSRGGFTTVTLAELKVLADFSIQAGALVTQQAQIALRRSGNAARAGNTGR